MSELETVIVNTETGLVIDCQRIRDLEAEVAALKEKLGITTASITAAYNAYEGEFWKCRKAEATIAEMLSTLEEEQP